MKTLPKMALQVSKVSPQASNTNSLWGNALRRILDTLDTWDGTFGMSAINLFTRASYGKWCPKCPKCPPGVSAPPRERVKTVPARPCPTLKNEASRATSKPPNVSLKALDRLTPSQGPPCKSFIQKPLATAIPLELSKIFSKLPFSSLGGIR